MQVDYFWHKISFVGFKSHIVRFKHNMVVVAFTIPAHTQPIKTVGVLNMPDGPKLLTGSTDSTVKVRIAAAQVTLLNA